ncbi:MAG: hypothetical protein IT370_28550 [Deltaproteobacteria bacterium]|nr:hypothetical protein [Deltaproteobacteria bacterium]
MRTAARLASSLALGVALATALTAVPACGPSTSRPPRATPAPTPRPGPGPDAAVPELPAPDAAMPDAAPVVDWRTRMPPLPARYRVTLLGGTLPPTRPDGRPWDGGERTDSAAPAAFTLFARYLAQHPELEAARASIGLSAHEPDPRKLRTKSPEPDAYVFIELGDQVFRSPVISSSLAPTWSFPMQLVATPGDTRVAKVTVVDWDGSFSYDVLGEAEMSVGTLISGQLGPLRVGPGSALTFMIEPPAGAVDRRVAVRGKAIWHDTAVDIVAGQRVHLEAAGEVCSSSGKCGGPEGQGITPSDNLEGLGALPHGGLVASLGDTRFFVGRDLSFVAPASGRLLLGLNDRDASNNSGFFDARIRAE